MNINAKQLLIVSALSLTAGFGLAGCDGPAEERGERIDDARDHMEDAREDAAEAHEAIEDAHDTKY